MYRDGPDCALSMSKFPMFRLGIVTLRAALAAGLPAGSTMAQIQAALPDAYAGVLSPPYDLTGLAGLDIALSVFGGVWSDMVTGSMAALAGLPTDIWSMLAYEDLLADPADELRRLTGFIGVPATPAWLTAAGALADPVRAGAAARLDPAELARLRDACARNGRHPGLADEGGTGGGLTRRALDARTR
jgi:hypothetical protein